MVYIISSNKTAPVVQQREKNLVKNLHNSLKKFMIFSQFFGILPLENSSKSPGDLRFQWKSWKVVYTCALTILTNFVVVVSFFGSFFIGYTLTALANLLYLIGSSINLMLYLRMAKTWPNFLKLWCKMDKIMNKSYGYPKGLDYRFKIIPLGFLLLAISDNLLGEISKYLVTRDKYQDEYTYEKFYKEYFPQVFHFLPVNWFTATICSFVEVHSEFVWIINDSFLILVSTALALRFKQIKEKISKDYKIMKSELSWAKIRGDYDRLSILCKELNDKISYMVLVSYFLNMFALLIQLYHTLETISGVAQKIYFFYSFCLIILKLVSVSLYGAWINDESLEPASILNAVSSDQYNNEIRRLLLQISFDNVAITGFRMFKITRGIILSIAGAIVTYELVLIQFKAANNIQI